MRIIEDFFHDVDAAWSWETAPRIPLRLIGSTALFLQTSYVRGTKDSDILELQDLTRETKARLLSIAGPRTKIHERRKIYLDIVGNGIPFMPWPARWHPVTALAGALRNFDVSVLDVVDVVVSKLKRLHEDDLTDVAAMVERDLVPHAALIERFRSAVDSFSGDARASDLPKYVRNLHRVERDVLGVDESEVELPSWI